MTMQSNLAIAAPLTPSAGTSGARERVRSGSATTPASGTAPRSRPERRHHVHNPWVDFLTLGGGSLVVLGAMAAFYPRDEAARVALAGTMLFLAHFVNHPHFAHSYQVFYRGFVRKAFAPRAPLAARYRFAGILVPALLAVFFAVALVQGSVPLLGLAANLMFFTVGWHYAKQGYGILMLDAARAGLRFGADERRRLLWNTHLTWITWWLIANDALKAKSLWGITYYLIDVPDPLLIAMAALVAVSTLGVGRDLFRRWRAEGTLPWNGLLAYVAAVYVWLMVGRFDPILLFIVPFFHSLQYMAVVWRYQLAVEADRALATAAGGADAADTLDAPPTTGADASLSGARPAPGSAVPLRSGEERGARVAPAVAPDSGPRAAPTDHRAGGWRAWLRNAPAGLARFALVGGVLGAAGFWWAPNAIDALSGYERAVFGTTLFLFIGWTFINIHHYFIDNVIWRRENPETRRYLFGGAGR